MDNSTIFFLALAAAFSLFAVLLGLSLLADRPISIPQQSYEQPPPIANQTTTTTLSTGHDAVPVLVANRTTVVDVAPAAAINTLLTTIFGVAIPALTALIIAIVTYVQGRGRKKTIQKLDSRVTELERRTIGTK